MSRLREIEQAATPGPWKHRPGAVDRIVALGGEWAVADSSRGGAVPVNEDAVFIATARNTYAALLDVYEAARDEAQSGSPYTNFTRRERIAAAVAAVDRLTGEDTQ